MPLVPYKKLVKVRITRNPCPICGKRPEMRNSTIVEVDGKMEQVCTNHVNAEGELIP